MTTTDLCCTLAPYFQVAEGKMPAFKQLCERFVEQTRKEPKCLHYGFSFNGNFLVINFLNENWFNFRKSEVRKKNSNNS